MLNTRIVLVFAATAGLAAAQGTDSAGVSVDLNGAMLMHRAPVAYPEAARAKNVKGSVTVEMTLDGAGNVTDAHVMSGPEELRKAVLQSVLNWHFAHETAGMHKQATIAFDPAAAGRAGIPRAGTTPDSASMMASAMRKQAESGGVQRTVGSIQVLGLSDALKAELLGKLPLHEGDALTPEAVEKAAMAVREFDEHMTLSSSGGTSGAAVVQVGSPEGRAMARMDVIPVTPGRIKVGGNVQQSKLVSQARPAYPPLAKQARIQGVVQLQAVIGKDGTVVQLEVLSGHPLLVPAALDAVKQWVYQTTLLNGSPVEVITQIDVNFTLSQ